MQNMCSLAIKTVLAALICLNQCGQADGVEQADYYNLITFLFTDYKPEVRPTLIGAHTDVYITFTMLSIQELDEKEQVFVTSVVFVIAWVDPWLTWDIANFSGVDKLRYPQKKLWLPDVVVLNSVESQAQLGYADLPLRIEFDGYITWSPTEILRTSCDIDVTYYPFDEQKCSITLSTWVSYDSEINLDPSTGEIAVDMSQYSKSGTWEFVSYQLDTQGDYDNHTVLKYTFTIRRLRTYYVVNIILPVLFLSLTASMVFYLPSDSGEKMGMSITVLLAFAVYLTIISDNMPQTSLQTSILSVYLTMLLAVTAKSVIMSVIVLNFHHRPDEYKVPRAVVKVVRKLRTFFGIGYRKEPESESPPNVYKRTHVTPMSDSHIAPISTGLSKERPLSVQASTAKLTVTPAYTNLESDEEEITWKVVGETIDRICFVGYSIFILVVTIVSMALLASGGN